MSLSNIYTAGLHNVGSYQVAGRPYLSGSAGINASTSERFVFPQVSKSILVKNTDGSTAIRILSGQGLVHLPLRCMLN